MYNHLSNSKTNIIILRLGALEEVKKKLDDQLLDWMIEGGSISPEYRRVLNLSCRITKHSLRLLSKL